MNQGWAVKMISLCKGSFIYFKWKAYMKKTITGLSELWCLIAVLKNQILLLPLCHRTPM